MARFKNGAFVEMTLGKAWTLGTAKHSCGATIDIKINKSGSPYFFCTGEQGCGVEKKTYGNNQAAKEMVMLVSNFGRKCSRKRAYALIGLIPCPEYETDDIARTEHVQAHVEPETEATDTVHVEKHVEPVITEPIPKKTPLIELTFFGKKL